MDAYRFYIPDLREKASSPLLSPATGTSIPLSENEGRHAFQVLRLAAGSRVELFDGRGATVRGAIQPARSGRDVAVVISEAPRLHPKPPVHLTIATGIPKGDRAEWLIEQSSQLNVAAVQWLACDRGVVKPKEGGQKMEKWRRLAVESAKQCGRHYLMEIAEPVPVERALTEIGGAGVAGNVLWLEPGEEGMPVAQALQSRTDRVVALIGPEGGWSDRERELLEAGVAAGRVRRVRLTSTVLRIETACAAIAAIVMSTGAAGNGVSSGV